LNPVCRFICVATKSIVTKTRIAPDEFYELGQDLIPALFEKKTTTSIKSSIIRNFTRSARIDRRL